MAEDVLEACAAPRHRGFLEGSISLGLGSWRDCTITGPGLGSWAIPQPPCGIPVFKENGGAGAEYLIKSFLSRGGTARTYWESLICKHIPVLGCPRVGGAPEDVRVRSKGKDVSASQTSLLLSSLPALSKEAGGGGKTVTERVFAIWARVQPGWHSQISGVRSCRTSGGGPHVMFIVLVRS